MAVVAVLVIVADMMWCWCCGVVVLCFLAELVHATANQFLPSREFAVSELMRAPKLRGMSCEAVQSMVKSGKDGWYCNFR